MPSRYFTALSCPICCAPAASAGLTLDHVPVHTNCLYATPEAAHAAVYGTIELGFCQQCGHIFNQVFDPRQMDYTPVYENSLHFSPRFQQYILDQAMRLADRYALRGRHIVDIGCGKGEFLMLLCDYAGATGTGFDPSYVADRRVAADGITFGVGSELAETVGAAGGDALTVSAGRVTFVQDYYTPRYAGLSADLVCCRHVLEHIAEPRAFLTTIRSMLDHQPEAVVFFEVPNADYMVRNMAIWDLVYEHSGYYSAASLRYLFESCGFEVCALEAAFDEQYLTIEARPRFGIAAHQPDMPGSLAMLAAQVTAFATNYRQKVAAWHTTLRQLTAAGRRIVVWGAGTKGVMFLNTVGLPEAISYVVDVNPRKQGMYVAGTGQPIMAPAHLRVAPPDVVLVMNPIYLDEIRRQVHALGVTAECLSV